MFLITVSSALVLALWWGALWLWKRHTGEPAPNTDSASFNSRKYFLQNLLLGYLGTTIQVALMLALTDSRGIVAAAGFGLVIFFYSFVLVGMPVLVLAIIVGYPVHFRVVGNRRECFRIWSGYIAAAIASVCVFSFIVVIFDAQSDSPNSVQTALLYLGLPAIWVGTTSAIMDRFRKKGSG